MPLPTSTSSWRTDAHRPLPTVILFAGGAAKAASAPPRPAPPTGRRPASAPGGAGGATTQHKRKKPTSERAEEVVVTCPKGAAAGSEIDVRLADGGVSTVEVPAGIKPGQKFTICVLPDAETEARVAAEDAERARARPSRPGCREQGGAAALGAQAVVQLYSYGL